jgi:multimeric flavodoxin WrbA
MDGMTSIVLVNGSPRSNGNTAWLINTMQTAVTKASTFTVQVLRLQEYQIKPCQACDWCMTEYPLTCIQDDDMHTLYPAILNADIIVFASPIYWFHYSAQLKLFIDRFYALHTDGGHALQGKKFAAIFVYGDTDQASSGVLNAIGSYKALITYLHGTDLGIVSGTAMRIGDAEQNHALLADIHTLCATLLREPQRA